MRQKQTIVMLLGNMIVSSLIRQFVLWVTHSFVRICAKIKLFFQRKTKQCGVKNSGKGKEGSRRKHEHAGLEN